ncbi:MAG TPA: diiron oxygenase [Chloroflexia bacterium]|nr:diiron oxygenase [Chloroflexia bacterium]
MPLENENLLPPELAENMDRLYRRALAQQWAVEDLPWQLGIKLNERQRVAGRRILSQVLYGEQASLEVMRQLLEQVSEPAARPFLSLQARDEERHVAVFERYLALLGGVEPPGAALAQLVEGLLELPGIPEKTLGMQLVVEGMALETFHAMAAGIDDPLLQAIVRRVFVDESRHVAFGTALARDAVASLDRAGKERVAEASGRFAVLAAGLIREEQESALAFGIDLREVQRRTLRVLFRRLARTGLFESLALF